MYEPKKKKKKKVPSHPVRQPTRQRTELAWCLPGWSVETDALWDLKRHFVVKLNCGGLASAQLRCSRKGLEVGRAPKTFVRGALTEFGENRWRPRRPKTLAVFHPAPKTQKNLVFSPNLSVCWFPRQSRVCQQTIETNVCQPVNKPAD